MAASRALYSGHIPTTVLQKMLLGVGSAAAAILDPRRGDMVATCGEVSAGLVLPRIRRRMEASASGSRILSEQPEVTNETVDREYLRTLPDNTLGREYGRFLDKLNTSPDARPPVQFVDEPNLAYVMRRYRQTHDFYHVVLGQPTTMVGEVVVKWWEGLQLGLPMAVAGGLFGAVRLGPKHRQRYLTSLLPWVLDAAPQAEFLMNVYWEEKWARDLVDLRAELNILEPPTVTAS